MGGLGHVAVKLGVARRAEITVFTTTSSKLEDAKRMGAHESVLWSDKAAFARLANHFDLIISTVPESYPMQQFVELLKLDATFVNVGALGKLEDLDGMLMAFGRKSFAGSLIGGIAETQEVIDYCAARNITADIEIIKPEQIDMAYERVIAKDVRYRFVIDFASARKA
ncbi:zinc-binding dehydrogenase [Pseudomonas fluorescens]